MVQQLVENLIDCKVLEIESIKRTPADGELSTTSGGDYFTPESRPSSTGFNEMPFELVFVADNTALQKFLNLLAESYRDNTGENKRLFLVRRLETETVLPSIHAGPSTRSVVEEHVKVILAGDEKVKVTLRVDWVQVGMTSTSSYKPPPQPTSATSVTTPNPPQESPADGTPTGGLRRPNKLGE